MNIWRDRSDIIVSCAHRIAPYLLEEVQGLGFKDATSFKTGVKLQGTLRDCMRLNLYLRTASQVYFSLAKFNIENADELYAAANSISWEDIIPQHKRFAITSNVRNETIDNNLYANVRLKDAIVDRMRNKTGTRPDSGPALDQLVIYLYWKGNEAEIFLDTSGETLSKHGYRKIPGKAPMMESLAAATIIAGKWNRQSPFVNPMCGSGTLAIEAALMASNKYPGLFRSNYSFMHILGYDKSLYAELVDEMKGERRSVKGLKFIATDISDDAINISKINAGIAGVDKLIDFYVCDFAQTQVPAENEGAVYFNPEYGDRLGAEPELEAVYKRMGDFMKQQCKGYYGYILTGHLELAKKIGLKASRRMEFFNGKIDCRLLEYELYGGTKRSTSQ